jgi:hypothetical protein
MTIRAWPSGQALREAVAARVLSLEEDQALETAVGRVVRAARGTVDGVIFFGSRRTGAARANVWSAYDVFVTIPRYKPFYEALHEAGLSAKGASFLAMLSCWLPPTQYSIRLADLSVHLKAAVIQTDTFHRETSPRRLDHFCIGRLFQPSRILYARDESLRAALVDDLVFAHAATWDWSRPWLPPAFDADGYGANALDVSMSWEVRPEPPGRARALWQAQKTEQKPVFDILLNELGSHGELDPTAGTPGEWRATRPPGPCERWRVKVYFRRSMLRATARWMKHVLTFEGWLEYILRKAQRHGGGPVELTERERRWPLVFLWPRLLRYLRTRRGSR